MTAITTPRLADFCHLAVITLDFDYAGQAVIMSARSRPRLQLRACRLGDVLCADTPIERMLSGEEEGALAFLFPAPGEKPLSPRMDAVAGRLARAAEDRGVELTIICAQGAVRLWRMTGRGWVPEPDSDPMTGEELSRLIRHFVPVLSEEAVAAPSSPSSMSQLWRLALDETLLGQRPEVPGGLKVGGVRDEVIIWAVNRAGDSCDGRGEYVPPTHAPDPHRINAALSLLGRAARGKQCGYALACAAYLGWWCGYRRLTLHVLYSIRAHGLRTRLADLVWVAVNQEVDPPWMG